MTPKEKAIDLVHKFCAENQYYERAKQCALICVNEIIASNTNVTGQTINGDYWLEVKQEIEKL